MPSDKVDKNRMTDAEMEAELQELQAGEEEVETMLEHMFALGVDQARSKFKVMCQIFLRRIETLSAQMLGKEEIVNMNKSKARVRGAHG